MPDPEYVRIKITDIPAEFIEEYKLAGTDRDGWIYFEIRCGCYGLPQAGILANDLLRSRLLAEGYYEAESTPGLWRHKWRPIQFCLIVDDFGVEYVGIEHFTHLLDVLKKFHGVQFNMAGDKFAGINIKWDYANSRCHISMPGYIETLLIKSNIPVQASHVSPLTSVFQSPMVLSPSSLQKRMSLSSSTNTVYAEFKKLSARYSTMPEQSTTSSW
jgi:hypothetical protein